jgi:plasmid stabilization system protein ParE
LKVVLTRRAQAELRQIGRWIARDNPRRGKTYVEELLVTCRSLSQFPEQWAVVSERPEPVRRAIHGNYLIFYVLRPWRVLVTAITHGSRLIDPGRIPTS